MTMNIKRYNKKIENSFSAGENPIAVLYEQKDGPYCMYEDYAALEAKLRVLQGPRRDRRDQVGTMSEPKIPEDLRSYDLIAGQIKEAQGHFGPYVKRKEAAMRIWDLEAKLRVAEQTIERLSAPFTLETFEPYQQTRHADKLLIEHINRKLAARANAPADGKPGRG